MRRISKVKPKEISLCNLSANRRMFGLWKSANKTGARAKELSPVNISDAISNTSPGILRALGDVAKSVSAQDGRQYTPQAASIIKAVGRLLAPFAEELTLSDLQAVGKAAGLGTSVVAPDEESPDTTAPAFKSAAKATGPEDEDEDDEDEEDLEEDAEDEDEEDDEESTDEATTKSAGAKIAARPVLTEAITKAASDEDEEDEDDMDEEKSKDKKDKKKGLPPEFLAQAKAKGDKVAKSAHSDPSLDSRFEEIMVKHRQLAEENKSLREAMNKSRADLDAERDYRELEGLKKSINEDFGHLNLEADTFAPVLKAARAADAEHYQALRQLLKTANDKVRGAQNASGIFEAVGKSSSHVAADQGVAWADRIESAVDEQMKKSAGQHRAVVYDKFIQTPEGREMLKNHRRSKGRI